MAKIDLSGYNLAELKGLQFDIEKEIKNRQQQDVKKAREQILEIAQNMGISVEELLAKGGAKSKKAGGGAKVNPQYHNPADNSQTWTGRGRQPKWVVEALGKGKSLDDLRI
ncbi:DNA-binding protein H-NS [Massilia sp. UYP11]|uniref:H-NS histone family protein n=1 Tax=Massilia sp. UYP11 TaxID=1756385 RepID=UPI003D252A28